MRCQVNLSDEMVVRVDSYAKKMGVSRSALCSMLIGQSIMNFDKSATLLDELGKQIGEEITSQAFLETGKILQKNTP